MAKKNTTTPDVETEMKEIRRMLFTLDHVANALNTAVLSLAYIMKVKGDELDKVDGDALVEFTQNHMHPLVRRADEIIKEVAERTAKSAKEAVEAEPTKEEFEEAVPVESVEPITEEETDGE